ncbi:hypothetical protein VV11_019085 [Trichodesmium erythraeum 21-75]|nr:hypothetical protein [Trichodesmium erythraeum 21-75]
MSTLQYVTYKLFRYHSVHPHRYTTLKIVILPEIIIGSQQALS